MAGCTDNVVLTQSARGIGLARESTSASRVCAAGIRERQLWGGENRTEAGRQRPRSKSRRLGQHDIVGAAGHYLALLCVRMARAARPRGSSPARRRSGSSPGRAPQAPLSP